MLVLIACILRLVLVAFGCQLVGHIHSVTECEILCVWTWIWTSMSAANRRFDRPAEWQTTLTDRQTDRTTLTETHIIKVQQWCKSEMGSSIHHFSIHEINFHNIYASGLVVNDRSEHVYFFLIEYPVSLVNTICQMRLEHFMLRLRVWRSVGQTNL